MTVSLHSNPGSQSFLGNCGLATDNCYETTTPINHLTRRNIMSSSSLLSVSSLATNRQAFSFPSEIGWMAVLVEDTRILRLVYGYDHRCALEATVDFGIELLEPATTHDRWVHPLQDYAAGERVDFSNWKIKDQGLTSFQQKVTQCCRRIRYGRTVSYAELAALAGSPKAARAVGNTMAHNCAPLVVPCHRVVGANGSLGGYSSPKGLDMKRRLLQMEGSLDLET